MSWRLSIPRRLMHSSRSEQRAQHAVTVALAVDHVMAGDEEMERASALAEDQSEQVLAAAEIARILSR